MKYYLSSYKLGNETATLKKLIKQTSGIFGYIPNALDFVGADPVRRTTSVESDMDELRACGATVSGLDLREYFGRTGALRQRLRTLGGLYVRGGNSFVLRQAFRLSGLDTILTETPAERKNFLYIAYSAGVCILAPDMKAYAITDDANNFPYPQLRQQIWEGLGLLDFIFEPHYKSDHPESASTDKEIQYCVDHKLLFRAYRDGEVLVL